MMTDKPPSGGDLAESYNLKVPPGREAEVRKAIEDAIDLAGERCMDSDAMDRVMQGDGTTAEKETAAAELMYVAVDAALKALQEHYNGADAPAAATVTKP